MKLLPSWEWKLNRTDSPVDTKLLASVVLLFAVTGLAQTLRYSLVPRETIEARLRQYSDKNAQREATLKQLFIEAGCAEHLSEQHVSDSRLPNIICVLPGSSDKVILVGAHFDHVSAGDGVVDNWSGASLLPSLYQILKLAPRQHTYILIGFTDEEVGEVGSHFYAHEMTKTQVAATDAMVNMDTLGLGTTEVWASQADKTLTSFLIYIAKQLNAPLSGANVDQIGSTDSVQFAERKIPSITIHSLTQQAWNDGILHSSKDKISAMNLDNYYQTYQLVSAYLVFLDHALIDHPLPAKR